MGIHGGGVNPHIKADIAPCSCFHHAQIEIVTWLLLNIQTGLIRTNELQLITFRFFKESAFLARFSTAPSLSGWQMVRFSNEIRNPSEIHTFCTDFKCWHITFRFGIQMASEYRTKNVSNPDKKYSAVRQPMWQSSHSKWSRRGRAAALCRLIPLYTCHQFL